jgi:hypothetical protein
MAIPKKICGIPFPLAVAAALVLAYVWIYGRATFLVWRMKKEAAENPMLAMVPVPLSDHSISTAPGTTVAEFGYQFEVPWKMNEPKRENSLAIFESQSGEEIVIFWDPAKKQGFVRTMKDSLGIPIKDMAQLYGAQTIQSSYDFDRALLNTTPSQLTYILPGKKVVRTAVLLMLKPLGTLDAQTGLYSFETDHLRGFQNGDPKKTKTVMVEVFDAQDHEFQFAFGNRSYPKGDLTQADINRFLQTLRPAPASPDSKPTAN